MWLSIANNKNNVIYTPLINRKYQVSVLVYSIY